MVSTIVFNNGVAKVIPPIVNALGNVSDNNTLLVNVNRPEITVMEVTEKVVRFTMFTTQALLTATNCGMNTVVTEGTVVVTAPVIVIREGI